jgi:hypothetical protein
MSANYITKEHAYLCLSKCPALKDIQYEYNNIYTYTELDFIKQSLQHCVGSNKSFAQTQSKL